MRSARFGMKDFQWGSRVYLMGIVNVTPDSFSGDGLVDPGAAVDHGLRLVAEGADILDVGGESTRPGHVPVDAATELTRVLSVVRRLVRESGRPVSIDTWKTEVAQACAAAGASIVNDVWGLQRSPDLAQLAAREGLGLVLMHNQEGTAYEDLVPDVIRFLSLACARAEAAGVQSERVIIDPGIGFGKNGQQNLELMRRLGEVRSVHHPMLIGTSRKSFIGTLLDLPPDERLEGTAATVTAAVLRGADIVRVHDVRAMTRVVRVAEQLRIRPTVCYLGLGANIGNREHQLSAARAELVKRGVTILRESSIAETEPFGVTDQPRFLNQVLEVEWAGTPHELLAVVKAVESAVGRTATYRWGPREIDVDVLLFGDERIDTPDLKVPHPGLFERAFVLAGLHELRPDILTR